jgi:hypothetical protein
LPGYRAVLALWLAVIFLSGQWANVLHGQSHLKHDLAAAAFGAHIASNTFGHSIPPLDHPAEDCVAFHALDCKASAPVQIVPALVAFFPVPVIMPAIAVRLSPAVPFQSRAPPATLS